MNYIINPSWFYWLNVVEGVQILSIILFIVFLVALGIVSGCYFTDYAWEDDDDKDKVRFRKWIRLLSVLSVIFGLIMIFIPSKTALIQMQIAKFATYDNAAWTVDKIKDAVDYIIEAMKQIK